MGQAEDSGPCAVRPMRPQFAPVSRKSFLYNANVAKMDVSAFMTSPMSPTSPFKMPRSALLPGHVDGRSSPAVRDDTPGPVARLLPELLSIIFYFWRELEPTMFYDRDRSEYFLQPERRLGWVKSTHVCRAWRQVTLDNAHLWNNIVFEDRFYEWGIEMLKRSRRSQLSVHRMRPGLRLTRHATMPPVEIVDAVSAHTSRLRTLTIEQPSNDWEILEVALSRAAPFLEELNLSSPSFEPHFILPPKMFDGNAPRLRRVKLTDCYFLWPALAFETVTHLDISRAPRPSHASIDQVQKSIVMDFPGSSPNDFVNPTCDFILDALRRMPHLESLILTYAIPHIPSPSTPAVASSQPDPVKLHKLSQLHMTEHTLSQCAWILDHVQAPHLDEIRLKAGGPDGDGLVGHTTLLPFLSTSLGTRSLDMLHASTSAWTLKLQAWEHRTDTGNSCADLAFAPASSPGPSASAFRHACVPLLSVELVSPQRLEAENTQRTIQALCGSLPMSDVRALCVSDSTDASSHASGPWTTEAWRSTFGAANGLRSVYGSGGAGVALVDALAADSGMSGELKRLELEQVDLTRVADEGLLGVARARPERLRDVRLRRCIVSRPVVDRLEGCGVKLTLD
ncbi:hypothetical protein PENSPDRAFT_755737 [Peniophora sp. CONT]|nr:hypothetical protein PENSPDRAFT_755737 [Peniophora sp. CONT]